LKTTARQDRDTSANEKDKPNKDVTTLIHAPQVPGGTTQRENIEE
jgi:hypothetical protein